MGIDPITNRFSNEGEVLMEEEELIDLTENLVLHSKKTERLQRRKQRRKRSPGTITNLRDLPYDLVVLLFSYLRPSDVFRLSRTCKWMREFILSERDLLARNIIRTRYPSLAKCLRLPVLYDDIDNLEARALLPMPKRVFAQDPSKWPYHHIKRLDPDLVCSCWTCGLQWIALSIVVDWAHFRGALERGDQLPIIARGKRPQWNDDLLSRNANILSKALHDPLWHAALLEAHLVSMTSAINRHTQNKGNKRARFRMTQEDWKSGTDAFLERSGPPTMDFPFHRENYYMLEAYMPNRSWIKDEQRWIYTAATAHDMDLQRIVGRHAALHDAALPITPTREESRQDMPVAGTP